MAEQDIPGSKLPPAPNVKAGDTFPAVTRSAHDRRRLARFSIIADELKRQADDYDERARHVKDSIGRLGFSAVSAARVAFQYSESARLIRDAHFIISRLEPVEATMLVIIGEAA